MIRKKSLEMSGQNKPKVRKLPTESPVMFWLEFINNPNSPKIADMYSTQAVYQEARKAYQRAIADPEVQELLRIRDKAEMDYADAMARAVDKATKKAEGKAEAEKKQLVEQSAKEKKELVEKAEKEKIESAKNLLKAGISMEIVASSLGLSLDEVKNL